MWMYFYETSFYKNTTRTTLFRRRCLDPSHWWQTHTFQSHGPLVIQLSTSKSKAYAAYVSITFQFFSVVLFHSITIHYPSIHTSRMVILQTSTKRKQKRKARYICCLVFVFLIVLVFMGKHTLTQTYIYIHTHSRRHKEKRKNI